jgi:hypothetical protein
VAHEFSHILNGDMRLNIRLIGLIFGIMVLSIVGRIIMQSAGRSSSSSNKRDSRGGMILLGLGLFVLGLVGAFFGRLIQAAVSRQREYLADASAVQFTRNPDGIAGALKKIGGLSEGSRIENPRAAEVSHMFFASGRALAGLLATHPPLADRIRAIDPQFDGRYPEVQPVEVEREEIEERRPGRARRAGGLAKIPGLPQIPVPVLGLAGEEAAAKVGQVTPKEIRYAEVLHGDIPDLLLEAAEEPFGARALVYALLFDPREEPRNAQIAQLKSGVDPRDFAATMRLSEAVQALPDGERLPLVDLAMPALRQMSPRQHQAFRAQVERLMTIDRRLSLFEYTLGCVLHRHLDAQFLPPRAPRRHAKMPPATALKNVLSVLAWEGQPEPEEAAAAFAAGMNSFIGSDHDYRLLRRDECSLAEFDSALQALNHSSPAIKRRIVAACAACIMANEEVTVREAELLRAIGDTLDCPLPPLAVQREE